MRLFYALMPSDRMIAAMQPVLHGIAGARWQTARQLHVTTRFVGEVSIRTADELADALPRQQIALPLVAFSGVGFFETKRPIDALWVRAIPREPLAHLHQKLDRVCQAFGLPPEGRAYLPHMTVARLPRMSGPVQPWLEHHAGFTTEPMVFARLSLVESIMGADGSHYEELASITPA